MRSIIMARLPHYSHRLSIIVGYETGVIIDVSPDECMYLFEGIFHA
jgi:hypothetical protein